MDVLEQSNRPEIAICGYPYNMSKAKIMVSCGELQIWLEIDSEVYPDQLTDLCNRASILFGTALLQAKSSGVNVMAPDGEFDDDAEDFE